LLKYSFFLSFVSKFLDMKKLYFLSFLLLNFLVNAQIINFPDANFKAALFIPGVAHIGALQVNIDTNNDGEIQISEAELITGLNISSSNISSLIGVEYFTNLKTLNCENNLLTNLDVSNLGQLVGLRCNNNQISNLYFGNIITISSLYCYNNSISNLNIDNLVNLVSLDCHSNLLSNLNLTNLVALQSLSCQDNLLTSVDLSTLTNLIEFSCAYNNIENLDFSNNSSILRINCTGNLGLVSIFIKNSSLEIMYQFNIDQLPNLEYICVDEEQIDEVRTKVDSYGYFNCVVNDYCSFTPGGYFYEIIGEVKFDYNNDGCDVADFVYPNLKLDITDGVNSGHFIANVSGAYYIPVGVGNHVITPVLENLSYFNITPPSFTVDFPTQDSPFTQDFCVTTNGEHSDLDIVLIPLNNARPGFEADYLISCRNIGNRMENGTISFYAQDPNQITFVSSFPSHDEISGSEYKWNFSNLAPFGEITILIKLNVNSPLDTPPVNIGDFLGFEAFVELDSNEDEDLWNNYSNIKQTVVGSYDPNDKTCVEGEIVEPSMIGKYVHYVIRFENTGTYPAQNIVVKDMIDASKFDLSSLVPLHSSHDFFTRIKDNKVEFIFENINLDFNDAANNGYVAFKIKTLPTLTVGDTFSNEANIYFDYNFPITTNNYVTTIQALSNPSFEFGDEFALYPNPVKDILNISSKHQTEIKSVEIYNIIGQLVIVVPNAVQNIDVSSLESGTYFVKVNSEKGSGNTKFIKE